MVKSSWRPSSKRRDETRVGRFGWKDQHGSLLSFVSDAYLNEMGVTSRLRPKDVTTVCKTTTDPEDVPDSLGLADIDHFAQFIRATTVPPRDTALAATNSALHGQRLFQKLGCQHLPPSLHRHCSRGNGVKWRHICGPVNTRQQADPPL